MFDGKENKCTESSSKTNTILKYFAPSLIEQSKTAMPRLGISKQKKKPPCDFYLERLRKQHDEQINTCENEDNGSQDITLLEVSDDFGSDDDNGDSDYVKCNNIECIDKVNYYFYFSFTALTKKTRQFAPSTRRILLPQCCSHSRPQQKRVTFLLSFAFDLSSFAKDKNPLPPSRAQIQRGYPMFPLYSTADM